MIELDFKNLTNLGFIIVGQDGYRNSLKISSKKQYDDLLSFAKNKRYYVYYGELKDGIILLPYILDIASTKHKTKTDIVKTVEPNAKTVKDHKSVEDHKRINDKDEEDVIDLLKETGSKEKSLTCPNCGKEMSSSSGYTLHLKKCKK